MANGRRGQHERAGKDDARRLLTAAAAARHFGIGRTTFYALLPRLKAKGLKTVVIPSAKGERPITRYDADSIDRMIDDAGRKERPLC